MFKDNLKELIGYKGLFIKELAARTGISKRTIDTYVDSRAVIPNAEIAVKLAQALDTTVEFLVTGAETKGLSQEAQAGLEQYRKYKDLIADLDSLPPDLYEPVAAMVRTAAAVSRARRISGAG